MELRRTIVEEDSFLEIYEYLALFHPRIDDVKRSVDDTLSVNPTAGAEIHSTFYVWNSNRAWQVPSYSVLYRYDPVEDDNNVFLIRIRPRDKVDEKMLDEGAS